MKIVVVYSGWIGGWMDYVVSALQKNGHDILTIVYQRQKSILRLIKLHNIVQVRSWLEEKNWQAFNIQIIEHVKKFKPEIFLTMNESYLLPHTIKIIREMGSKVICFVADNPFDSSRYTYFPISLKYFNNIMVSDRIWIQAIKNVAPASTIIKIPSGGGFDPQVFFPIRESDIKEFERTELSCDISFTGESYGIKAEGSYRAGILDQLGRYNVKIWGDEGWLLRFPYYAHLQYFYQGGRLPYDKLRKLYHLSTINLNMPSPQIFTGFQPRVFEIAACKGFQIVDWREELDEVFSKDELVTFKNVAELRDKINYFLKNPEERQPIVDNLYRKVQDKYKWEDRVNEIVKIVLD